MLLAFAATVQLFGESLMQKHRKYFSGGTEIDDVRQMIGQAGHTLE